MNFSQKQSSEHEMPVKQGTLPQSRDYKCPCGKTYLSYAALFTHVKNKHNGQAPGEIEKPRVECKPRGRPPLSAKAKMVTIEKDVDVTTKDSYNIVKMMEENQKNSIYFKGYQQIFTHLKFLYAAQQINPRIMDEVGSFKLFQQFVDSSQQKNIQFKQPCVGYGLSQFLKGVALETQSFRFEQILILFMLLLQYVIDQCNNPNIISQAPIQILIEYMNPFLNYHIDDYSQHLGIKSELWISDKTNIHNIFLCFYNWLKWKDYTGFCITLID